jgi:hypothetical protein
MYVGRPNPHRLTFVVSNGIPFSIAVLCRFLSDPEPERVENAQAAVPQHPRVGRHPT